MSDFLDIADKEGTAPGDLEAGPAAMAKPVGGLGECGNAGSDFKKWRLAATKTLRKLPAC